MQENNKATIVMNMYMWQDSAPLLEVVGQYWRCLKMEWIKPWNTN